MTSFARSIGVIMDKRDKRQRAAIVAAIEANTHLDLASRTDRAELQRVLLAALDWAPL